MNIAELNLSTDEKKLANGIVSRFGDVPVDNIDFVKVEYLKELIDTKVDINKLTFEGVAIFYRLEKIVKNGGLIAFDIDDIAVGDVLETQNGELVTVTGKTDTTVQAITTDAAYMGFSAHDFELGLVKTVTGSEADKAIAAKLKKEFKEVAGVDVDVEVLDGTAYVLASELITLKLLKAYRFREAADTGYSENMNTHFFKLELCV